MLEAVRASPKMLWRAIDSIHGSGRLPPDLSIAVDQFIDYFTNKVASS
jgi:hypothetical protein